MRTSRTFIIALGFVLLSCQPTNTTNEVSFLNPIDEQALSTAPIGHEFLCKDAINSSSVLSFSSAIRSDTSPTRLYLAPLLDLRSFQWLESPRDSSEIYFEAKEFNRKPGTGSPYILGIYRSRINFLKRTHDTKKILHLAPRARTVFAHSSLFSVLPGPRQIVAPNEITYSLYSLDSIDSADSLVRLIDYDCPQTECTDPRINPALNQIAFLRGKTFHFYELETGVANPHPGIRLGDPDTIQHSLQWLGAWGAAWMESRDQEHSFVLWEAKNNQIQRIPLRDLPKLTDRPVFYMHLSDGRLQIYLDTQDAILDLRWTKDTQTLEWFRSILKPFPTYTSRLSLHGSEIGILIPKDRKQVFFLGEPWRELSSVDCSEYTFQSDPKRF